MMDARQAELGKRLAANPPAWAKAAWGMPPAEAGPLRADWERLAGTVESYREAAGITDPEQAVGPVPSNKAHLAEAFHASVRALRLPDEAALLKAMNRGQLEAVKQEYIRAAAVAPPDVQAEVGDREHSLEEARARIAEAHTAGDVAAAETAEAEAAGHAQDLARLSVADAARREWREATAEKEAAAREAVAELARRGLPESETEFRDRLHGMVTRDEATPEAHGEAEAEAQPAPEAESEAEFLERLSQVRAEAEARQAAQADAAAEPQAELGDVDPELVRQAGEDLDAEPVRAQFLDDMAEIRAGNERVGELVDQLPDRQAEQRAQHEQEIRDEPGIRPQAEAEPSLESSWQPRQRPGGQRPAGRGRRRARDGDVTARPFSRAFAQLARRRPAGRKSPAAGIARPGLAVRQACGRFRATRHPDWSHLIEPARRARTSGKNLSCQMSAPMRSLLSGSS